MYNFTVANFVLLRSLSRAVQWVWGCCREHLCFTNTSSHFYSRCQFSASQLFCILVFIPPQVPHSHVLMSVSTARCGYLYSSPQVPHSHVCISTPPPQGSPFTCFDASQYSTLDICISPPQVPRSHVLMPVSTARCWSWTQKRNIFRRKWRNWSATSTTDSHWSCSPTGTTSPWWRKSSSTMKIQGQFRWTNKKFFFFAGQYQCFSNFRLRPNSS